MACRTWPTHVVPTRCTRGTHTPEHTNYTNYVPYAAPKQAQAGINQSCMQVWHAGALCSHESPAKMCVKGGAAGPGGRTARRTRPEWTRRGRPKCLFPPLVIVPYLAGARGGGGIHAGRQGAESPAGWVGMLEGLVTGMQEEACGKLTRNEGALPLLQRLRVALGLQAV